MEFLAVTSGVWDLGLVLLIVGGAVVRLAWYVWRKDRDRLHTWEPFELTFLRNMVILVTGKSATHITWYHVDLVMFVLLLIGIILGLRN